MCWKYIYWKEKDAQSASDHFEAIRPAQNSTLTGVEAEKNEVSFEGEKNFRIEGLISA